MLAKLSEKRYRQKQKQRTRIKSNPETAMECFQISVNIIEARNLARANSHAANTYVVVTLGNEKYKTNVIKTGEQCCGEVLLFEWYTTLGKIQKSNLTLTVMEPRCCAPPRLLGETNIDLGVIWAQPNHQIFHKWALLRLPREPAVGTVGFLKVNVSIMCRGYVQVMPVPPSPQKITQSPLPSLSEQQPANYLISVYNLFGLTSKPHRQGEQKLSSTFIKVTFSGISARTSVQMRSNNPSYCEQISIAELFPNFCQTMRLEVCSAVQGFNPILASIDLNLGQISYDGDNGFVPTYGPSLLHMYGNNILGIETPNREGPFYRGALLVALKTIVPSIHQATKITNVEPIAPIPLDNLWSWEDYCLYCPILEVSMLDSRLSGRNCGVAVTIGEIPFPSSDNNEFMSLKYEIKRKKLYYTGSIPVTNCPSDPYGHLYFTNAFPVLQHAIRLPSFRFRILRNNLMQRIAENLEKALRDAESRLNNYEYSYPSEILIELSHAVDVASNHIQKFFDVVHLFDPNAQSNYKYNTELDHKQLAVQKEELEKLHFQLKEKIINNSTFNLMKVMNKTSNTCYSISKKNVIALLAETTTFAEKLKTLVFKTADGWPDLVVWLLNEGSRFAFHKVSAPDVLFCQIPELSGKDCGRIQTIYMKPLKCSKHLNILPSSCTCLVGKIELLFWLGLYSDVSNFNACLPKGCIPKSRDCDMCLKASIMMVKCNVYIYRAKLTVYETMGASVNPFVRINVFNSVKQTQVKEATLTPIWDEVLTVNNMIRTSQERMAFFPPEITVEMYHQALSGALELIGRAQIEPVVGTKLHEDCSPKLKWHDLHNKVGNTGQIMMSAFLQLVPETLLKSTTYISINEVNETQMTEEDLCNDQTEEIPRSLKPKYSKYKIDIYWWGLRDVNVAISKPCAILEIDELNVKSDIIAENKSNCNFPNGRITQTFETSLDNGYCPPLSIKLYDSSTYGRIIFSGPNVVKNPLKYLMPWLPEYEREASLKTTSFMSSDFFEVNKTLFVKKSKIDNDSYTENSKITINSSMVNRSHRSTWKKLFCRSKPDEEEFLFLPMSVAKECPKEKQESETESHDWWSRFYSSQEERADDCGRSNGKIKIYNSELENQPEFKKFKDWCCSLKLYNGQKKRLRDKNEISRCGILKVGIAIYRWPPPPETVAVNVYGVDLQRGFFDDFPYNNPCKFLVRIYIVRGLDLAPQDFNGKYDPYIVIKCGTKQYGDRGQCLQNTANPIIGRMYECQCSLPDDYLLIVSMYNRDTVTFGTDTLIGSTDIDLENRIYSKHRGRVGMSLEYKVTGVEKWRDYEKPSDILTKTCIRNHMKPPVFPDGNTVVVNDVKYRDADKSNKTYISASERKENICLNLLHKWHTLPLCGYNLVPEHVETRNLLNPEKPGVNQGKLLMWVDIFPLESEVVLPVPVDITPRTVEEYELRVVVWNVQYSKQEKITNRGLDLYVKAWIGNVEQAHYTDIHYNCFNGEASFNWRMIFNFQYQQFDKKLILTEKGSYTESEERLPPALVVQVAECDAGSNDDYLAMLKLDLNAIPCGSKQVSHSTLDNIENKKKINLFSARLLRSWWPLKTVDLNIGASKSQGFIDIELHLLPKSKAIIMPVGLGRDPPFPLPAPNRQEPGKLKDPICARYLHCSGVEYIVIGTVFAMFFVAWLTNLPFLPGVIITYNH